MTKSPLILLTLLCLHATQTRATAEGHPITYDTEVMLHRLDNGLSVETFKRDISTFGNPALQKNGLAHLHRPKVKRPNYKDPNHERIVEAIHSLRQRLPESALNNISYLSKVLAYHVANTSAIAENPILSTLFKEHAAWLATYAAKEVRLLTAAATKEHLPLALSSSYQLEALLTAMYKGLGSCSEQSEVQAIVDLFAHHEFLKELNENKAKTNEFWQINKHFLAELIEKYFISLIHAQIDTWKERKTQLQEQLDNDQVTRDMLNKGIATFEYIVNNLQQAVLEDIIGLLDACDRTNNKEFNALKSFASLLFWFFELHPAQETHMVAHYLGATLHLISDQSATNKPQKKKYNLSLPTRTSRECAIMITE